MVGSERDRAGRTAQTRDTGEGAQSEGGDDRYEVREPGAGLQRPFHPENEVLRVDNGFNGTNYSSNQFLSLVRLDLTYILTEDTHLQVLRIIETNPKITQRDLAKVLGVSLGKVSYCVKALIEKGWIKTNNFKTVKTSWLMSIF